MKKPRIGFPMRGFSLKGDSGDEGEFGPIVAGIEASPRGGHAAKGPGSLRIGSQLRLQEGPEIRGQIEGFGKGAVFDVVEEAVAMEVGLFQ